MKKKAKCTSIYEIAEKAGVSVATVSRVINNSVKSKPETVKKIQQVIEELGYVPRPPSKRPGPNQGSTRKETSKQIMLLTSQHLAALSTSVYSELLEGIEDAAANAGINLIISRNSNLQQSQDIDGAILFNVEKDQAPSDLPCINIMKDNFSATAYDTISYDDKLVGTIAADHLIEKGCKTAILVSGEGDTLNQERVKYFIEQFEGAGGVVNLFQRDLFIDTAFCRTFNTVEFNKIIPEIQNAETPVGIYTIGDSYLPSLYSILNDAGIKPQQDVHIITANNSQPIMNSLSPKCPAIDIHVKSIGQRAIDQLLWRINNPTAATAITLINPTLV